MHEVTGCQSVQKRMPNSQTVDCYPCTNPDPDHHGQCTNGDQRWTRLSEHLRQMRLEYVPADAGGPCVRPLEVWT